MRPAPLKSLLGSFLCHPMSIHRSACRPSQACPGNATPHSRCSASCTQGNADNGEEWFPVKVSGTPKGVGAAMRASDACLLAWMRVRALWSKAAAHHVLGLAGVKEDSTPLPEILQALLLHGCQLGQTPLGAKKWVLWGIFNLSLQSVHIHNKPGCLHSILSHLKSSELPWTKCEWQ